MTRWAALPVDPELGPVKWCPRCEDHWPYDAEFWFFEQRRGGSVVARCKGCWQERIRQREQRRASNGAILGPCPCQGCGAIVSWLGGWWADAQGRHACAKAVAA